MADSELAKIRAARLQQLQQNASAGSTDEGGEEAKRRTEEEMRRDILATVLDSAARERRASPL